MVLVSPPLMLATTAAEKITFSNKKFFIGTQEVRRFIVCGVVTDEHTRFIKLCDFYGEIGFYKSASLILPSKNIRCQLRLFLRSGKPAFYCESLASATIYDNIVSALECQALKHAGCYNAV